MPIDISGLDKADVLAVLYNAASPVGMGFLRTEGAPAIMDRQQARYVIEERGGDNHQTSRELGLPVPKIRGLRFDYVHGRPLKVDLDGDVVDTSTFDRIHGDGAARHAIAELRRTGEVSTDDLYRAHVERLRRKAAEVLEDPESFTILQKEVGIGDFTERLVTLARRELGGDTLH